MFQKLDKNHRGYLTKIQFNQLFKQFDIHLNEEELYHIISEIDKNQDGIITYDELYYSLITNALQI
jgi:Ca2+-binding EF-hand superfamily protein